MVRKTWFPLVLTLALLSACGGNNSTQAVPTATASASVDPNPVGGDPGGALTDTGASNAALGVVASPPASLGSGFTLKGIVTDAIGKPLANAKISIGSQTILSDAKGTFEIDGIMDTKVSVDVVLDGYEPVSHYTINFTTDAPSADKEFRLVAATGTATGTPDNGGSTSAGTPASSAGFSLQATYQPTNFKSVTAMVVDGNIAYVLGMAKSLVLTHNTVAELNAQTGEELKRFNKISLFSYIPKEATGLSLTDGQVNVSNGSTTYVFGSDGSLIKKTSGGAVAANRQAVDDTRHLTYKITGGSKIDVTNASGTTSSFLLSDATSALAIGVDTKGDVLVLDGGKTAVLQYTFRP